MSPSKSKLLGVRPRSKHHSASSEWSHTAPQYHHRVGRKWNQHTGTSAPCLCIRGSHIFSASRLNPITLHLSFIAAPRSVKLAPLLVFVVGHEPVAAAGAEHPAAKLLRVNLVGALVWALPHLCSVVVSHSVTVDSTSSPSSHFNLGRSQGLSCGLDLSL